MFNKLPLYFIFLLSSCSLLGIYSCKKKGTDKYFIASSTAIKGPIKLLVQSTHHGLPVAGLKFYYKLDATKYPGSDVREYDYTSTGDSKGYAIFDSLRFGDAYLYAIGYDPIAKATVTGNMPINFTKQNVPSDNQVSITLYVSE